MKENDFIIVATVFYSGKSLAITIPKNTAEFIGIRAGDKLAVKILRHEVKP